MAATDESDYPRVYRTSWWWLLPPLAIGLGLIWAKAQAIQADMGIPVLVAVVLLALAPSAIQRVTLHPDWIEIRAWGRSRRMLRQDMAGWRRFRRRGIEYVAFMPNRPDLRSFEVAVLFPRDVAWWAWLRDLPDLGTAERAEALEWLASEQRDEPALGGEPAAAVEGAGVARWRRDVGRARMLCWGAGITAIVSLFPGWLGRLALVCVAVVPWVALLLAHHWRDRYPIQRSPDHQPLTTLFWLAGMAPVLLLLAVLFGNPPIPSPSAWAITSLAATVASMVLVVRTVRQSSMGCLLILFVCPALSLLHGLGIMLLPQRLGF